MLTKEAGDVDWGEIWRTIREVTPEEWAGLKDQLHQAYRRLFTMMRRLETWDDNIPIGGALAILVHTAYHLGEIRQALGTLQVPSASP